MVNLKAHQLLPIKFMQKHKGLILYHSTGSGKTLTALFAMYQFARDIIIIGPKSSKKAFTDDIVKSKLNPSRITFYTYAKIKKIAEANLEIFFDKSVIVDEAHNLRSDTINNLTVISALKLAYKVILLTATPIINYLNDLAVLINIAKFNEILPTDKYLFRNMYYNVENGTITNKELLEEKLHNCISYYKQSASKDFPQQKTEEVAVVMSEEQMQAYVHYVNKLLLKDRFAVNPFDVDFDLLDKRKKNYFLSATRQLSNSVNGEAGPKIMEIYKKILKGPYPIIVYSNFLKNGIYPLAALLEKGNISYRAITGDTTNDKIDMIVNVYNARKFKVLLLSSAGSEALDFKNTRSIHIMEPFWNEARTMQVIGRAIRFKSHEDLPEKDRNIVIYRWLSIFPKEIVNISADQYLMALGRKKQIAIDEFIGIIKKVAIEKNMDGGHYDAYVKYKNRYLQLKSGYII